MYHIILTIHIDIIYTVNIWEVTSLEDYTIHDNDIVNEIMIKKLIKNAFNYNISDFHKKGEGFYGNVI